MQQKAILLLSGGIDSVTAGAVARREGYDLYALSFDYGQRHRVELRSARRMADALGVKEHLVMPLDLSLIGGSALTDDIPVPKEGIDLRTGNVPATYVPARNTIFLSVALGWAEVTDASTIVIGVNAVDYSGYPDCRPEYLRAFEQMGQLATKRGIEGMPTRILAPLLTLSKGEIIRLGTQLGIDFALTNSCYDPDERGIPCRKCDSCLIREQGFTAAQLPDPLILVIDERRKSRAL